MQVCQQCVLSWQAWFAEMPRPLLQLPQKRAAAALGAATSGVARAAGTIDQYYLSRHCAVSRFIYTAVFPRGQAVHLS